ncbi:MAG: hypothetical protein EZS28_007610 [Streblomastix strix]|uniref:Reverse transcriptase domain-containing protein n=1 Tax=Streblomastix strix TaxID=222440 RepID=A0A5J4WQ79_9EUKA|nr:MAG: hypothetical protein EZS28_007610 [Streblomastix strix]
MAHHRVDDDDDKQQINQQNRNLTDHGAQNADANQIALLVWLNVLMGRPRDTQNAIRALQQRDATTKQFEHFYGNKASELNPTNEKATKRDKELLFQKQEEILGSELNKETLYQNTCDDDAQDDVETSELAILIQRACVAASTALIQGDFPATLRFILICHQVARVIVSDASQRRDVKLAADEFNLLIGKKGSVLNTASKQSKDQIKELNTSIKLITTKFADSSIEALQQLEVIQKYKEYYASLPQMMEYARQLEKQIKEGIVLQTDQIKVINPIFLVHKPGNKWRKILDCIQVNAITNLIKLKNEGSDIIKQILEKQDFAKALDLENEFHHVKVLSDLLHYFCLAFQGKLFTYSDLPFGYKNAPYLFNKVLSIAVRSNKQRQYIKISNYIDGIVLLHQDKDYLKRTTQEIIAFLQNFGFKIQLKKSYLYPSRVLNYLGWIWNSNLLEVMMTPQRR